MEYPGADGATNNTAQWRIHAATERVWKGNTSSHNLMVLLLREHVSRINITSQFIFQLIKQVSIIRQWRDKKYAYA